MYVFVRLDNLFFLELLQFKPGYTKSPQKSEFLEIVGAGLLLARCRFFRQTNSI